MKKLLALLTVLVAAGCAPEEVVIPENDADLPPVEYMESTIKAEEDAKKQIALITVNEAIQGFKLLNQAKRYPVDLEELVEEGMLPSLPDLPAGFSFSYDAKTGKASIEGEHPAEPEVNEEAEEAEEIES